MVIADIIIPVAPFHADVVYQAMTSAEAQTLPCNVIVVEDTHQRGAAWARNQGASQGDAPFIIFLDADDTLHPEFTAQCAKLWASVQGYIYTDWIRGGRQYNPPDTLNIFETGMFHIVTTLLPRKAFEQVGGFDETLPTLEDEDLYRRLQRAGLCPHALHQPLVEYRMHDGNSAAVRDLHIEKVERFFNNRDSGLKGLNMCACNDAPVVGGSHISGDYHEGDILAYGLYTPRRMRSPTVSNRVYEKALMGLPMWIAPSDAQARPDLWHTVQTLENLTPDVETVLSLIGA